MRMKSPRTKAMITAPEVPRLKNGGVALCHLCQRQVFFANGFIEFLVRRLDNLIRFPSMRNAE